MAEETQLVEIYCAVCGYGTGKFFDANDPTYPHELCEGCENLPEPSTGEFSYRELHVAGENFREVFGREPTPLELQEAAREARRGPEIESQQEIRRRYFHLEGAPSPALPVQWHWSCAECDDEQLTVHYASGEWVSLNMGCLRGDTPAYIYLPARVMRYGLISRFTCYECGTEVEQGEDGWRLRPYEQPFINFEVYMNGDVPWFGEVRPDLVPHEVITVDGNTMNAMPDDIIQTDDEY